MSARGRNSGSASLDLWFVQQQHTEFTVLLANEGSASKAGPGGRGGGGAGSAAPQNLAWATSGLQPSWLCCAPPPAAPLPRLPRHWRRPLLRQMLGCCCRSELLLQVLQQSPPAVLQHWLPLTCSLSLQPDPREAHGGEELYLGDTFLSSRTVQGNANGRSELSHPNITLFRLQHAIWFVL